MNIITVYTIKDYILLSNIPSKGAGSPLVKYIWCSSVKVNMIFRVG